MRSRNEMNRTPKQKQKKQTKLMNLKDENIDERK